MQKPKVKLKSEARMGRLVGKVLRLLRGNVELQAHQIDKERIACVPMPVDISYNHRDAQNALLNAEYEKAGVLMELQRHRTIQ